MKELAKVGTLEQICGGKCICSCKVPDGRIFEYGSQASASVCARLCKDFGYVFNDCDDSVDAWGRFYWAD